MSLHLHLRALAAGLLVVAGCTSSASHGPAGPSVDARVLRSVVVDTDLDTSDVLALAILLRDPGLDVRAITVAGTGLVHCGPGVRIAAGIAEAFGRVEIPVACGRQSSGPTGRQFPEEWRATADDAYGTTLAEADRPPGVGSAADVLASTISGSPEPPVVVALGPWTNLADTFDAHPTLAGRVAGVHAMGGTIDALGNVTVDGLGPADRIEWNFAADPAAVGRVFELDVPITLLPLDATDDVPVPSDLLESLAEDHSAAGANLAYELVLRFPGRITDPGSQLWDELAALTLSAPDLATWETAALGAEVTGSIAGRIERRAAGREVRFANAADPGRVEAAFLAALRAGAPRPQPFEIAGELAFALDQGECRTEGPIPSLPGLYRARFEGPVGSSGVLVLGPTPPRSWDDVASFLATAELETMTGPPAWLILAGQIESRADSGSTGLVDLAPGIFGPVCVAGSWPDLTLTPGEPFIIGG